MPDNRGGALPAGASEVESDAALATLDNEEAGTEKAAPAASAAATDVPPAKQEKPDAGAAPVKKTVWEEAGFKTAEDMAKSYGELRGKYNARDKEISALRDGREELGKLKGLIFPDDGGDERPPAKKLAAAVPLDAAGREAAQDPVESIRTFLGADAADYVKGLQDEVGKLRGDFDDGRRASDEARTARIEQAAENGIAQLIEDVGGEEYARVMRNPRFEKFAAKQIIVDGLDPAYVYAGLSAVLNEARAKSDTSSSGQAGSDAGDGGALPPGGKPGGPKKAAPKTEEEQAYEGMQEALKGSSPDFFEHGRDK